MSDYYDAAFAELRQQIHGYSPQAAARLVDICASSNAQAAYYAAFILVVLRSQMERNGYQRIKDLSVAQMREFTFFEYVKDNPEALTLFDEIFKTYQAEQLSRLARTD